MIRQRPRHRSAAASVHVDSPPAGAISAPDMQPSAAYGNFAGAMWSSAREYIYVPEENSRRMIDSFSRREIYRRVDHLYNNTGVGRGLINNIARMEIGTGLIPEPVTGDPVYNANIKRLWRERAESQKGFSICEKFSCGAAQRALKRSQRKDGDAALIPVRDPGGRLRFALREGREFSNGTEKPGNMWDGVSLGLSGNPLAYRVVGRDFKGIVSQYDVPASSCFFLCEYERAGQVRGTSILTHAIEKLQDRDEIDKALTKGIKTSSQIAYYIKQQAAIEGDQVPGSEDVLTGRPSMLVADTDGKPVKLEKMLGGGEIHKLGPGQSFEIVHDERPHANVTSYKDDMIREVAVGTGYTTEILWNIEALGGANTRFIMASAQGRIDEVQREFCQQILSPAYLCLIQDWEAFGDLPPCRTSDWWKHQVLSPARMTVDFGKDNKVYLDNWTRGLITSKEIFGMRGLDDDEQESIWLDEIARKKKKMEDRGLTAADLPVIIGAPPAAEDPPEPTLADPPKKRGP